MAISQWFQRLILSVAIFALTSLASGPPIIYCSPDLTAGSFQAVFNTWQSNGACQTTCQGSYAFAVLRGQNCWCSNYAPQDQVSTYDCNTACSGFPSDWCGNDAQGLYGYYQMDGKAAIGTTGGSNPSGSSSVSRIPSETRISVSAPTAPSLPGIVPSLTVTSPSQSSVRTSRTTAGPSSTNSDVSQSSSGSKSASPTAVYTSVTTVTGVVQTIIVTPTSTDSTLGSGSSISSSGGGVSTGKVAGIVIGVALGLGLVIGLGVWFWLRRRHQSNLETVSSIDEASSHANPSIPSRQVSQMSSAGLLSKAPRILTTGIPSANYPRSADTLGSSYDRRSVGTDQRLNPYAIYAHEESRHSNVSLQDNQDYSRQLRVANPDP